MDSENRRHPHVQRACPLRSQVAQEATPDPAPVRQQGFVTFASIDYAALARHGYLSHEFDRIGSKFAFCRNSYDREVSLLVFPRSRARFRRSKVFSISAGDSWRPESSPSDRIRHTDSARAIPRCAEKEDIRVDFFGRYENLPAGTAGLLEPLQLSLSATPRLKARHEQDYPDYYCDESHGLVNPFYAADFDSPTTL